METILDSVQSENKAVVYAGFWLRFVAALIDGIILWIVGAAISMGLFGGMFLNRDMLGSAGFGSIGLYYVLTIAIDWIYYAGMESSARQATLGKAAIGIKVTDMNGERISFARATGRHFAKFISALILLIGYLMAAFTEKKQALHDQIAETLVVRK